MNIHYEHHHYPFKLSTFEKSKFPPQHGKDFSPSAPFKTLLFIHGAFHCFCQCDAVGIIPPSAFTGTATSTVGGR
jgi:hypothetical protein